MEIKKGHRWVTMAGVVYGTPVRDKTEVPGGVLGEKELYR